MLVRDTPVAIRIAQSDCQPERKSALRAGATPHDGDGKGDIFAGGNRKLFYVERLRRLVILEEQIPRFPVLIHSSRLQRWWKVEHHDVLLMMGKDTGKIMPADCVRPCFDKRFDLVFGRSALLLHGSRSYCLRWTSRVDETARLVPACRSSDPTEAV
jgi:hypothetical protein